ncbi:MAG: 23S rRNA (guanosine(2251)-2'-O)-methyltransferase RlmB [Proteobacteria bacterium]|nr:23S rRNA (guanosine(2251)-2'-O)-methyltransferase RlmB [Pseudomonadota bacterium]
MKSNRETEILYGIHPVFEAVQSGRRRIFELFMAEGRDSQRNDALLSLALEKKIPVKTISPGEIRSLSQSEKHQNVAARVSSYPYAPLDLEGRDSQTKPTLFLILDQIQDPQNLGAILRTALCAGANHVIVPKDRSAGATPAVSRASAGALEHIRLSLVTNLVNTIKEMKENDLWVFGLDRDGRTPVYGMDLTVPTALVIGGEGKGIRPLIKKACDELIFIPQVALFNSLNASAAGAVVLYEAFRQRNNPGL